jgi:hypothetical protein
MSKKNPDPETNSRFSSLADEVKSINTQQKNDKPRDDKPRDDKPRDDKPISNFKAVVNTRFDFTEELDNLKKVNNTFDKKRGFNEQKNNNFNRPTSFRDRVQYEIEQREKQKLDLEKSLSDVNSFPELTSNKIVKNEQEKIMNYIEKLTWVVSEDTKEDDLITPGLELLVKSNTKQKKRFGKRATDPSYIMEKLNVSYEKWKSEYIQEYGYDTYEKNYLFEEHDYFDKLEELHQLEFEDEIEKEREKEENDYYNEYEYYDD